MSASAGVADRLTSVRGVLVAGVRRVTDMEPRRRTFVLMLAALLVFLFALEVTAWLHEPSDQPQPLLVQPLGLPAPVSAPATPGALPTPTVWVTDPQSTTGTFGPTGPDQTLAPPPQPGPPPALPPGPAPSPAPLTASFGVGSSWAEGFIGRIDIHNPSDQPQAFAIVLRFDPNDGVRVLDAWNAELNLQGDAVVLTGGPLQPGASVSAGFEATKGTDLRIAPPSCTVNEAACQVS